VAEVSGLKASITLTLDELGDVVILLNWAADQLAGETIPQVVEDLSAGYLELMEELEGGRLEGFEPE
jgi:hypothetical protein